MKIAIFFCVFLLMLLCVDAFESERRRFKNPLDIDDPIKEPFGGDLASKEKRRRERRERRDRKRAMDNGPPQVPAFKSPPKNHAPPKGPPKLSLEQFDLTDSRFTDQHRWLISEHDRKLTSREFPTIFESDGRVSREVNDINPVSPGSPLIYGWPLSSMRINLNSDPEWAKFLPKFREYIHELKENPDNQKYFTHFTDAQKRRGMPERFTAGAYQERVYFHQFQTENIVMDQAPILKEYFHKFGAQVRKSFSAIFPPGTILTTDIDIDIWTSFALLRERGGHHAYHYHGPEGVVSWVAVLYLDVPHSQNSENRLWMSNHRTTRKERNEIALHANEFDLLLHPAWISHGTEEIPWKSLRSLVAANIMLNITHPMRSRPLNQKYFPDLDMEVFSVLGSYIYFRRSTTFESDQMSKFIESTPEVVTLSPMDNYQISRQVSEIHAEYQRAVIAHSLSDRGKLKKRESMGVCPDLSSMVEEKSRVLAYRTVHSWDASSRHYSLKTFYNEVDITRYADQELINVTFQNYHSSVIYVNQKCSRNAVTFYFDDPKHDLHFRSPTDFDTSLNDLEMKKIRASGGDVLIVPSYLLRYRFQFTLEPGCTLSVFYVEYESSFALPCSYF